MIGSRRCGDHRSPVLQKRLDAIQNAALWGCPDVVVVCSHNAKRRKADRLALEVGHPDFAPALSYLRSLQVGCRG
jgi:hypothetical protein